MTEPETQEALTEDEKLWAFRRATNHIEGSRDRWTTRAARGLTDEELREELQREMGFFGSSGERVGITCQAAGLKIWADRCVGSRSRPPILEGQQTVSFARKVYGISDPEEKQMGLF
jgi:hypothetical protein